MVARPLSKQTAEGIAPAADAARSAVARARSDNAAGWHAKARPALLMRELAATVDQIVIDLWKASGIEGASLLAVGGYGRGELSPFSDIDLLILLDDTTSVAEIEGPLSGLVTGLWDSGLDAGHSLRTLADCAAQARADLTVATSLLEARMLVGDSATLAALQRVWRQTIDCHDFSEAKLLEMRQRHIRFQDSPYSLEPNIKESPGGLRDLQVISWVASAHGLGRGWSELAHAGLITKHEASQLGQQEQALHAIRAHLHLVAGRREDRLVFDLQGPVAQSMGHEPIAAKRRSEVLMQRYYRAAKLVRQVTSMLLANLEPRLARGGISHLEDTAPRRRLDDDFAELRGLIDIERDDLFQQKPGAILKSFVWLCNASDRRAMTARTLRALWNARDTVDRGFRDDPHHRALFLDILKSPRGVVHALRIMNDLGILGGLLPPFRRIVGQMQHDLFHVYTVDQHILQVIRNLRRFTMPEHAHEFPALTALMSSFDAPWKLYLAALFHDIAKGRGGDHSELGEAEMRRFSRQYALDSQTTELLAFLVRHHLTMSSIAQKEDLADAAVIARFAEIVQTPHRLRGLYLLTVADVRGTSPKVWNTWKAKLLDDLFKATQRHLQATSQPAHEAATPEDPILAKRALAESILMLHAQDLHLTRRFWNDLDLQYFMAHTASEIAWHARALCRRFIPEAAPVVSARRSDDTDAIQILIYQRDESSLFARITEYLDRQSLSVLDARIYTTRSGHVLDSFLIDSSDFQGTERAMLTLVEAGLGQHLCQDSPFGAPSQGRRSRLSRSFPVRNEVSIAGNDGSPYLTISVTTTDRPGVLYRIARAMAEHRVDLRSARVTTLGERVEDTFLVTTTNLATERARVTLESALLRSLED